MYNRTFAQMPMNSLFMQKAYIDGQWLDALNHARISVLNPASREVLGTVPAMGEGETVQAVEAADQAFQDWRHSDVHYRAKLLKRWFDLIQQNKQLLADILTAEQGKPIEEAVKEVDYGAEFVSWFAEEAKRIYGKMMPKYRKDAISFVDKQPVGVVGAITPWNFPVAMITRKCAPALAAGCTLVIKPAEDTPFSAIALLRLAEQAGFPPGVINLVTGDAQAIGKILTSHPLVRHISFTGSTKIGKLLMQQCAGQLKKMSLELGGNAPFIVFEDADLDQAVQGAMASKFRNTGQTCVCINRMLVHEKVYPSFTERLAKQMQQLRPGPGEDRQYNQGPLIDDSSLSKVQLHIQDALDKGAKLIMGGQVHQDGKTFFQPTLLTEMQTNCLIAQEETFGPVAALFRFREEEEAVSIANDTPYGLSAYFYTQNMDRAFRVSKALEYGIVGINETMLSSAASTFGGMKESGIGREGGPYGIETFLEKKYTLIGNLTLAYSSFS